APMRRWRISTSSWKDGCASTTPRSGTCATTTATCRAGARTCSVAAAWPVATCGWTAAAAWSMGGSACGVATYVRRWVLRGLPATCGSTVACAGSSLAVASTPSRRWTWTWMACSWNRRAKRMPAGGRGCRCRRAGWTGANHSNSAVAARWRCAMPACCWGWSPNARRSRAGSGTWLIPDRPVPRAWCGSAATSWCSTRSRPATTASACRRGCASRAASRMAISMRAGACWAWAWSCSRASSASCTWPARATGTSRARRCWPGNSVPGQCLELGHVPQPHLGFEGFQRRGGRIAPGHRGEGHSGLAGGLRIRALVADIDRARGGDAGAGQYPAQAPCLAEDRGTAFDMRQQAPGVVAEDATAVLHRIAGDQSQLHATRVQLVQGLACTGEAGDGLAFLLHQAAEVARHQRQPPGRQSGVAHDLARPQPAQHLHFVPGDAGEPMLLREPLVVGQEEAEGVGQGSVQVEDRQVVVAGTGRRGDGRHGSRRKGGDG